MRQTRQTRQKEMLREEMERLEDLFSPEDLHARVSRRQSGIGIATIYRFLKERARAGTLHSYRHGRKRMYAIGRRSVAHFTCERCGASEHLDASGLDLAGVLGARERRRVCHFQLDVFGTCERCAGRKEKEEGKPKDGERRKG